MQNFEYCTPTRIVFGKGVIEKLPEVMGQYGKKVLLTYGGGSIRRIGLYQKVKELLKDFDITERIPEMARHVAENEGLEHAYAPLTEQDIAEILTASL